jgi:hypothetical protein
MRGFDNVNDPILCSMHLRGGARERKRISIERGPSKRLFPGVYAGRKNDQKKEST